MTRKRGSMLAFVLPVLCLLCGLPASAEEVQRNPLIIHEDHHDTSPPVDELARLVPLGSVHHVIKPLHRRPGPPIISSEPDSALQQFENPLVATTNLLNFDGVNDRDMVAPPDTNASVGSTQVVETVNTSYQVYNKSTGASVFGPAEISSIWAGFGGLCQTGPYFTDPIVLYDKLAGRWLITLIASNNPFTFIPSLQCIAVSTSSDATKTYNRYAFSLGSTILGDYDKYGVWPDAYYASYNEFTATAFAGAEACAYNRAAMLIGAAAIGICFNRPNDFSLLPSDLDGAGIATSGEPDFYLELNNSTSLNLFNFHVNFTTPPSSTFTGPTTITVAPYTQACAATGTCIPQPGTTQQLDSLGDRLMHRLAYRNFPGDHEALLATHSVKGASAASNARWYEIRSPGTAPVLFQQGTFSFGTISLWMASIGMDKTGDIALGMSGSSSSIHPSIGYTGRVPTDPPGTMEAASVIKIGPGSQNGGLSRWGDYTSMSIDPVDDCTFWYANEYLPTTGSFNWNTRLASFKFLACH